jgi:hypothetical protein
MSELQEYKESLMPCFERCTFDEYIETLENCKECNINCLLHYIQTKEAGYKIVRDEIELEHKLQIERYKLKIKILTESFNKKDIEIHKLLEEWDDKKHRKPVKAILNKLKKEFDFIN